MPTDFPPASSPTMHEIAERAGVGKATVSLALRDDPRLRPETRRRIQKLAAKMGYRTNATIANLMAQLRASRIPKYQATLGFLNFSPDPKASHTHPVSEWIAGCHDRASQLGYGLQHFSLDNPETPPARLASTLDSRAIRGLVIAGSPSATDLPDPFDALFSRFSCVAVGIRPALSLNYTSNDQFSTARHAVQRLWNYGYRRIGLVLSPDLDAAVDRRYSAGFWAAHEGISDSARIPHFAYDPAGEHAFRAWQAEHQPDVIVTLHEGVKKWLDTIPVQIPGEVALVHLDHHDSLPAWSGMRQNNLLIGAAAIDVLIGQLHRNESGLLPSPQASLIQSTWIDGLTTTHRNAGAASAFRQSAGLVT